LILEAYSRVGKAIEEAPHQRICNDLYMRHNICARESDLDLHAQGLARCRFILATGLLKCPGPCPFDSQVLLRLVIPYSPTSSGPDIVHRYWPTFRSETRAAATTFFTVQPSISFARRYAPLAVLIALRKTRVATTRLHLRLCLRFYRSTT